MEIIKVAAEDKDIVSSIIKKSFAKQAQILGITAKEYPSYVAFENPKDVVRAIKNGESVYLLKTIVGVNIGTVRFNLDKNDPTRGYINRLAVLPEYRKNSYGKILMSFAEAELAKRSVRKATISIVKGFERLQAYYQELGYRVARDAHYPQLPFEVRYMEKLI